MSCRTGSLCSVIILGAVAKAYCYVLPECAQEVVRGDSQGFVSGEV
jgi:hypothetical protein